MSFIDKILEFFTPWKSSKWVMWISHKDATTCAACYKLYGKIILTEAVNKTVKYPQHPYCRCRLDPLDVLPAGYATQHGTEGADYYLMHNGKLPDNYITKEQAAAMGWESQKGNLSEVANGKTIGGNIYENRNQKLPHANGRIWYEADINSTSGYRGNERILYSNDGVIFVTYDHYKTFYEISK